MTIPNRDIQILQKIQGYCDDIMFTHTEYDRNYNTFCSNPTYRNAIALCLLQIGELVGGLTEEYRNATKSHMQWHQIKGMRNMVAHDYGGINLEIVWDVITINIPELYEFCKDQLADSE